MHQQRTPPDASIKVCMHNGRRCDDYTTHQSRGGGTASSWTTTLRCVPTDACASSKIALLFFVVAVICVAVLLCQSLGAPRLVNVSMTSRGHRSDMSLDAAECGNDDDAWLQRFARSARAAIDGSNNELPVRQRVRGARARVHVEALLLGDSMVSDSGANALFKYAANRSAEDQRSFSLGIELEELLSTTFAGAHFRSPQGMSALRGVLRQAIRNASIVVNAPVWDAVRRDAEASIPRCAQGSARVASSPSGLCITSSHVSTFGLHGFSSVQFSVLLDQCMSFANAATLLPQCLQFLAGVQAGLHLATEAAADEVVFLVLLQVGVNNFFLPPGSWVPAVEARRVVSSVKTVVRRVTQPSVTQPSVLLRRLERAGLNSSVAKGMAEDSGFQADLLFPLAFAGRRRAVVLVSELPNAWTYGASRTKPKPHKLKTKFAPAVADPPAGTTLTDEAPNVPPPPALTAAADGSLLTNAWKTPLGDFPPARQFCGTNANANRPLWSLEFVETASCNSICALVASQVVTFGTLPLWMCHSYERELQRQIMRWYDELNRSDGPGNDTAITTILPTLLPLRHSITGLTCENPLMSGRDDAQRHSRSGWRNSQPHGTSSLNRLSADVCYSGLWLDSMQDTVRKNMRDCLHYTLPGVRRFSILVAETLLRGLRHLYAAELQQ